MNKKICVRIRGLSLILILMFTILVISLNPKTSAVSSLNAKASAVSPDDYLAHLGMPENVIIQLTDIQKECIMEHIDSTAVYVGYDSCDFTLDPVSGDMMPMYTPLPASDLTISVSAYKLQAASESGSAQYVVCPAFEWHKLSKVNGDSLAGVMFSGWETIDEIPQLLLVLRNSNGDVAQRILIDENDASEYGYVFEIPSNVGGMVNGRYEGVASFSINKKDPNATARISMKYVHDNTGLFESYSINIGVAGSITVTGSDKIQIQSKNFDLPGLEN